ncbi:MAG: TonB family protein [Thermodesulfobacteriota bacterium]
MAQGRYEKFKDGFAIRQMTKTNDEKTVRPEPPELVEGRGSNGIDKKLKTAVALSIAFHVVLLSLAVLVAPKSAPLPITIELTMADFTDKTALSGKKRSPVKKTSTQVAPSPKLVEENPPEEEEKHERRSEETASSPSTEEHGGIEAKSMASKSRHTEQFLSLVREKIEKTKFYPSWARKRGYEGVVKVGFTIKKDGNLQDLQVLQPCLCDTLNSAATEAIKKASPFGPMPETFPDEGIRLEIDVAYRLTD